MKYTTLDVLDDELNLKFLSLRSKFFLESLRKPALKTCLGLGLGFPETLKKGLRRQLDTRVENPASANASAAPSPEKDRYNKLKKKRSEKAAAA
mmetsp:Transcript_47010/g.62228  ORF Transcript_47010/g.62228 Transcript_47010/m.62228 type:complete len:94 (+) Transcript_47010:2412-2693(+)